MVFRCLNQGPRAAPQPQEEPNDVAEHGPEDKVPLRPTEHGTGTAGTTGTTGMMGSVQLAAR